MNFRNKPVINLSANDSAMNNLNMQFALQPDYEFLYLEANKVVPVGLGKR